MVGWDYPRSHISSLHMPQQEWVGSPTAPLPPNMCVKSTLVAFIAAGRACGMAIAVVLVEIAVLTLVLGVWEEINYRRRESKLERRLLDPKWIADISKQRGQWEVEQVALSAEEDSERYVSGAQVPRFVDSMLKSTTWDYFLWLKVMNIYSHRARVSIIFAIVNGVVNLLMILHLPPYFKCGKDSIVKQTALDVFALLGTEAALSSALLVFTIFLFWLGVPAETHARQTVLRKDDARLVYALMGLEVVDNPSRGSARLYREPGGAGGAGLPPRQFMFLRGPWVSTRFLPEMMMESRMDELPGSAYYARRLRVLVRLLQHLDLYDEVMLLLYPLPRWSARQGWEFPRTRLRSQPSLGSRMSLVRWERESQAASNHGSDRGEEGPGEEDRAPLMPAVAGQRGKESVHIHLHYLQKSMSRGSRGTVADETAHLPERPQPLAGLFREVSELRPQDEFVKRFWNKTQGVRNEVRNLQNAFVPIEMEIAGLIMRKIRTILEVLPPPEDLFFSLVTSLAVNWVITFIALFGEYDGNLFGVLYGGAQVTSFSGFWYFVLSVQWLKSTPRGYHGNRVRQVLDDIDAELARCRIGDGLDDDSSVDPLPGDPRPSDSLFSPL